MNLIETASGRKMLSGSLMKWTLTAVFMSLAAPVLMSAELASVESIVNQQCTQVQAAGGDLTRYEAWIAAVKNKAANEFQAAAGDVLRYSKEWLEVKAALFDARQAMEEHQRYATLVEGLAGQSNRSDRLGLELVEQQKNLEKTSDPAKKQALQDRIAALESSIMEEYGLIRAALSSDEYRAAKKYFGFGGLNVEDDLYTLAEDIFGWDFRSKMRSKERIAKSRVDDLETERKVVEKKFKKAREDYEDSRLMLPLIKEIDQRIRQCASGQSRPMGSLNATWMVSYIPPRQPTHRWCHSGQLVIEFDDAGQASDARITVDCTTSDVQMKKGGPWTRSNTQCPMPAGNWGKKLRIANVQADFASGQITAEVHHQDVSGDVGNLTGTIQRTGQPPYSYSGKGSMRFPSQDPASRRSHSWQSGLELKCQ